MPGLRFRAVHGEDTQAVTYLLSETTPPRFSGVAVDACGNRSAPRPAAVVTVPPDDLPHPECRPAGSGLVVTL